VIALALACGAASGAPPRWVQVTSYGAAEDETTVWVDVRNWSRTGRAIQAWVLFSHAALKTGEWYDPTGSSRAYQSVLQKLVIDCASHNFGYGPKHYYSGERVSGEAVHSVNTPVPKVADSPVPPGSVGDQVADYLCALKTPPR
jgi:hypothetical protein